MSIENNEEKENNNTQIAEENTITNTEKQESENIPNTTNLEDNYNKETIINIESNQEESSEKTSEEEKHIHVNKKIIGNAISAYLLLFISSMFLFNKKDEDINNSFVKSHTKSALVLHLGFFITWLIFMKIGFLKSIVIYGTTGLNSIFSIFIFLGLFTGILYGAYKAHLGKYFLLGDILKFPGMESTIVEEETEININEKNKLIVIMSFVPFIGYFLFPEHTDKSLIRNTTKLNLISTTIIILLIISNNSVLSSLFILGYLIFTVYSIVNLITKNEIPHIKLSFILSPEDSFHVSKGIKKYLTAFFKKEKFMNLRELLKIEKEKFYLEEKELEKEVESKNDLKFPKELIYIPLVNLIFIPSLNSKYKYHIRSGLTITGYLIITYLLGLISLFPTSVNIFILIPIFYGTGYLKTRTAYRMPYIYWLYEKTTILFNKGVEKSKEMKKIKEKNKKINLKVKNIEENSSKEVVDQNKEIPKVSKVTDNHTEIKEITINEEVIQTQESQEIPNIEKTEEEINIEVPILEEEQNTENIPIIDIEEIEEITTNEKVIQTEEEINIEVPILEEEQNILKENTISAFDNETDSNNSEEKSNKEEKNDNSFDISALEDSINIK